MSYKKKNNINVYTSKQLLDRRQELLDKITKSDTYLPDSILHDDLDRSMLDYVENNFIVTSDNKQIPIIPRILTIQRWAEIANTWEYIDDDYNIQLPFIAVVRKPDVQPGTNPSLQRTIPDKRLFHYATVKTWDGNNIGANVYKIPQPIPVDISYTIKIVCNKIRDLNRFNKIVLDNFSSRQDYTTIKGHYLPIILEKIEDDTPIDSMEGRRFFSQNYDFLMMGFLLDSDEFEIKPAVNRLILTTEIVDDKKYNKIQRVIGDNDITIVTFIADGTQTSFSTNEPIGILFLAAINGLVQTRNVDYFFIPGTSTIRFVTAPVRNAKITVIYKKGTVVLTSSNGTTLQALTENFTYDGTSLSFLTSHRIDNNNIIAFTINGLIQTEDSYTITQVNEITLINTPRVNSVIGITYIY